jgi:hypothetical protein
VNPASIQPQELAQVDSAANVALTSHYRPKTNSKPAYVLRTTLLVKATGNEATDAVIYVDSENSWLVATWIPDDGVWDIFGQIVHDGAATEFVAASVSGWYLNFQKVARERIAWNYEWTMSAGVDWQQAGQLGQRTIGLSGQTGASTQIEMTDIKGHASFYLE